MNAWSHLIKAAGYALFGEADESAPAATTRRYNPYQQQRKKGCCNAKRPASPATAGSSPAPSAQFNGMRGVRPGRGG